MGDQGYTPAWPGLDRYQGVRVHPQTWPEDLDYTGKRVLVIGSGATAATLIPAMVERCGHITMLQRSPTYFRIGRNANELADQLRALEVDETWIHEITRRKILADQGDFARKAREHPDAVKQFLLDPVRQLLGDEQVVAEHFTPRYRPWQQRLAFVPDADLFKAFGSGKATVVTDEIETFTETGLLLKWGERLDADVIVTATGFDMNVLGDIGFTIDGAPMAFHETVGWHGTMFTGVPNMAWVFGYFRASWTLRADMIGDFVCRLLNHMKARGASVVTPTLRPSDAGMALKPWVDPENFNPGYLMRDMDLMPRRGEAPEWQHTQDYYMEREVLPRIDLSSSYFNYK